MLRCLCHTLHAFKQSSLRCIMVAANGFSFLSRQFINLFLNLLLGLSLAFLLLLNRLFLRCFLQLLPHVVNAHWRTDILHHSQHMLARHATQILVANLWITMFLPTSAIAANGGDIAIPIIMAATITLKFQLAKIKQIFCRFFVSAKICKLLKC